MQPHLNIICNYALYNENIFHRKKYLKHIKLALMTEEDDWLDIKYYTE